MKTGRKCLVCIHKDRELIEEMLRDSRISLGEVSRQTGISKTSLHRHREDHMLIDSPEPIPSPSKAESKDPVRDPFNGADVDELIKAKPGESRAKTIDDFFAEYDRILKNEFPPNVVGPKVQWPTPIRKRIIRK